jgi:acyl carrier protein
MFDLEAAKSEILEWVSEATQTPIDSIEFDRDLAEIGIDSLDGVHLVAMIEQIIQQELPENVVQNTRTLDKIFALMKEKTEVA